jgi:sulfite reductase alpha subunit-like flavoprotein
LIAFTAGTGFAPIRGILQQRLSIARSAAEKNKENPFALSPISLFAGFQPHDCHVLTDIVGDATALGLLDVLCLVPSNAQKLRMQEFICGSESILKKLETGFVYVCGNAAIVKSVLVNLNQMMGGDSRSLLGPRYVEEIF